MVATSTMISPNRRAGRRGSIVFIGIHTMEAPEGPSTAENVAAYFAKPATQASSHWCVDNNSRVRCVNDGDEAWTMPPVNPNSLNIELAGYASQGSSGWNDAYSRSMLDNAAVCAAEWCRKYSIPLRRNTDAQIRAYAKGFVGHVDVNRVFRSSDHYDPGPAFPWTDFLKMVGKYLGSAPPPSGGGGKPKPNCVAFQRAVHTTADNQWGPETDRCGEALEAASPYGGRRYPYGVQYARKVVGTTQDGTWGPASNTALYNTVVAVQKALLGMGFDPKGIDGVWGGNTDSAYNSARAACRL
jgi:hypothetical protein